MFLLLNAFIVTPTVLTATAHAATAANCRPTAAGFLDFPTWYKYLDPKFENGACELDFDIKEDIGKVALAVFEIILRIAALVAVGFVIYGGFQYLISQGEPDKIKGARTTIMNSIIGLVITISATALVNVVARGIT